MIPLPTVCAIAMAPLSQRLILSLRSHLRSLTAAPVFHRAPESNLNGPVKRHDQRGKYSPQDNYNRDHRHPRGDLAVSTAKSIRTHIVKTGPGVDIETPVVVTARRTTVPAALDGAARVQQQANVSFDSTSEVVDLMEPAWEGFSCASAAEGTKVAAEVLGGCLRYANQAQGTAADVRCVSSCVRLISRCRC